MTKALIRLPKYLAYLVGFFKQKKIKIMTKEENKTKV